MITAAIGVSTTTMTQNREWPPALASMSESGGVRVNWEYERKIFRHHSVNEQQNMGQTTLQKEVIL